MQQSKETITVANVVNAEGSMTVAFISKIGVKDARDIIYYLSDAKLKFPSISGQPCGIDTQFIVN